MIAKREIRNYSESVKVWVGKYKNSHNLLHWHNDCEFLYVERGSIDVFCDKKRYALKTGDSFYIDSGQVHYMQACEPETVLVLIIFDYGIVRQFADGVRLSDPKLSGNYPVPETYALLRKILTDKKPFYGAEAACEVVRFMLRIYRGEKLENKELSDKTTQSFKRLLEDISEKFEFYTFGDAAAFMGMSDAYFSRYFRATTGITFSQYLNYVRTDNAVRMLHSQADATVTEISERCGFGTIRNFNRIFKELTGYSPKKLPPDFALDEKFSYPSDAPFNPTLYDCELIES